MKITMLIVAALAMTCATAEGAAKHKHKRMKAVAASPVVPYGARTPGPVWAQPGECYTDEGYGRYTPCGAGKDD